MPRHKDENWNLVEEGNRNSQGGRSYSFSTIHIALFMDLRDELKELNRTLKHQNELLREHTTQHRLVAEEKGRMNDRDAIMSELQAEVLEVSARSVRWHRERRAPRTTRSPHGRSCASSSKNWGPSANIKLGLCPTFFLFWMRREVDSPVNWSDKRCTGFPQAEFRFWHQRTQLGDRSRKPSSYVLPRVVLHDWKICQEILPLNIARS